jgi:hypothetical protein
MGNYVSNIKEEYRLRVLENKVLRKTSGRERGKMGRDWHSESFHGSCSGTGDEEVINPRRMRRAWRK